jgi:hypothetical protein
MTTPDGAAGASSPAEPADEQDILAAIQAMEAEIKEFDERIAGLTRTINALREDEDVPAGRVHAQEIFERQQEKLALDTEKLLRVNRIKRLRLDLLDAAEDGSS